MNHANLKQQAKADIRENYSPWLLFAVVTIILSSYQFVSQTNQTDVYGYVSRNIQLQARLFDLIQLILVVPFTRLAIHLTTNTYSSMKDSMFKNELWLRDIGAMLLVSIYTFLWTLLFIIPGIVMSYAYYFVPYILAEDNNISISEAILLSRKMTEGYKFDLFILDFSFILWNLASLLTFGLVALYVIPYKEATRAHYYLKLSR